MSPPRLVYIFVAHRNGAFMAEFLRTEGFFYLWEKLVEEGALRSCLCVIESGQGVGAKEYSKGMSYIVLPNINLLDQFVEDGDIVLARGGFKPWPPFLKRMNERGVWVLFYRAATGRGGWPYWDIVLNDLIPHHIATDGRLHYAMNKPIKPDLFYCDGSTKRVFDVIINASHIHDKKGQWKAIDAIAAHRKKHWRPLRACLPGSFMHGIETNRIMEKVKENSLEVFMPGMVSREILRTLYNSSKLYIHLGAGGQNDRGVLEAMACGCFVILGNPQYHAPFITEDSARGLHSLVIRDQMDPDLVANELQEALDKWDVDMPNRISQYFLKRNGADTVCLPQMKRLIAHCATHPVDRRTVCEEFAS